MIRSKMVLTVLFGALLALLAGSAAGAQDPYAATTTTAGGTTTTASTIPTVTVVVGESVDVQGDSCAPGSDVVVTWDDGTVIGTFKADANGKFAGSIMVPTGASVGVHTVTATCGNVEQYLNVNVLASSVDNVDSGTLARTGSSTTGPLVAVGAAAVVLGGAFLYGARRPRQA